MRCAGVCPVSRILDSSTGLLKYDEFLSALFSLRSGRIIGLGLLPSYKTSKTELIQDRPASLQMRWLSRPADRNHDRTTLRRREQSGIDLPVLGKLYVSLLPYLILVARAHYPR